MPADKNSPSLIAFPVITVDGPSGSGKGTICQRLASRYGFHLLDSGALYRLTALAARTQGLDLEDADEVAKAAKTMKVEFLPGAKGIRVLLEGEEVTDAIRKEEIGMGASTVAAHQSVRAALLDVQKDFQKSPGLVADGRDMGTVVFPNAEAKIFLTASAAERAQRRYKQLLEKGESVSLRALLKDIEARDERDSQRAVSPLKPAEDALLLDSTTMSIDDVVEQASLYIDAKGLVPVT
ncbi:(d)CMP kinase [Aurantivibrio infirmus]